MRSFTVLALSGTALARAGLWARNDVCQSEPYAGLQKFAYYAPAQSSCWENYPGPTSTVTVQPVPSTVWTTETCTETSTVSTCPPPGYTTTTGSTTWVTTTGTAGPTPTTTTGSTTTTGTTTTPPGTIYPTPTGGAARNQRRADAMAAAWQDQIAVMDSYGEWCHSAACSCIEGTKTVTTTEGPCPTTTKTVDTTTTVTTSICSPAPYY